MNRRLVGPQSFSGCFGEESSPLCVLLMVDIHPEDICFYKLVCINHGRAGEESEGKGQGDTNAKHRMMLLTLCLFHVINMYIFP